MYAIVYIVDGEPVNAYGPFNSPDDAEDAFEDIRDHDENAPELARTVALKPVNA